MGLRIMAHRASMIGGTFDARRNLDGGTTISCELPQLQQLPKDSK
jgi:signal transduction histidine kinase